MPHPSVPGPLKATCTWEGAGICRALGAIILLGKELLLCETLCMKGRRAGSHNPSSNLWSPACA